MSFDWTSKNVLVTGASGFLGAHLVRRLSDAGAYVVGLVPNRSEMFSLQDRELTTKMDVWYGSATDPDLLKSVLAKYKINVCFHVAAMSQVAQCAKAPVAAFEANIQATWVVLEACRRHGLSAFVGASSDKAYGHHPTVTYHEDLALNALHTYDVSKACADMIIRSFAVQYDLPAVVTRCANLYGPGDLNWGRIVPNTVRRLVTGKRPIIHEGAEKFVRELLYIDDAVDAYILLAERAETHRGQAFNVSADETVTVGDLVSKIQQRLGTKVEPEVLPRDRNFKEIPEQRMDSTKIRALGWTPKWNLDRGLDESVHWYRDKVKSGLRTPA